MMGLREKKFDDISAIWIQYNSHEHDRRTDRQTDGRTDTWRQQKPRLRIASLGKMEDVFFKHTVEPVVT